MKKPLFVALCAFFLLCAAVGEEPLSRYVLPNGLELYVYRDTASPLARMLIAFRAGAIAQKSENAGLFRLLERMILRGKDEPGAQTTTLANLSPSSWKAETGNEAMSYGFTLPSARLVEGLGFWARLLTAPLGAPSATGKPVSAELALEAENAQAIKELLAGSAEPETIFEAAMIKRLFAKFPWRRDPAGSEKALRGATLASLEALRTAYLAPNNAAIFVAGDVDPEVVRAAVATLFGTWRTAPNPWAKSLVPNPKPGVSRPTWIVYPDSSMPEGLASVEARYRGPDLATDPASSYAADLWTSLVADPAGRFKSELVKTVPKLQGSNGLSATYASQRDGGIISLTGLFAVDSSGGTVDRTHLFKERIRGFELTSMKANPSTYFSSKDFEAARDRLLRARDAAIDTTEGMVEALAFWWSAASVDYFLGYPAAIAKTGPKEIAAFLDAYIMKNLEIVALRMNPADYEREKKSFESSGFEVIGSANAFWWRK